MKKKNKITMKDIAKKAGVSQATVSRVINNHPSVRPEVRRRVMELIQKLDYQINEIARSLVRNKAYLIGVIIPNISNPYFSEIMQSIEKTAKQYGYNILFSDSEGDVYKETKSIEVFLSRGVDGLLIVPINPDTSSLLKLKKKNIPTVILTRNSKHFDSVAVDHIKGGMIIADHLIDLGHTKVAFVGNKEDDKLKGFKQRVLERGLEFNEEHIIKIESGYMNYYEIFSQLQKQLSRSLKFTGFFACNDLTAFCLIQILQEYGFRIGKDIAMVGFDNTFIASITKPTLTSVSQPIKEIGRIGTELLLKRINGNYENYPINIKLEPALVVRESSGMINLEKLLNREIKRKNI